MPGDLSVSAPASTTAQTVTNTNPPKNKPYEVLKKSLREPLADFYYSNYHTLPELEPGEVLIWKGDKCKIVQGEEEQAKEQTKIKTFMGLQGGIQGMDGNNSLWDAQISFGAQKSGTHAECIFGGGQVISAKLKAGHEFELGDKFGVDVSAVASARQTASCRTESKELHIETSAYSEVTPVAYDENGNIIPEQVPTSASSAVQTISHYTISNTYQPSDIHAGLEVTGIYKPAKNVKLGLTAGTGVSVPISSDTDPIEGSIVVNNSISVTSPIYPDVNTTTVQQHIDDINIEFVHDDKPRPYATLGTNGEIGLSFIKKADLRATFGAGVRFENDKCELGHALAGIKYVF